MISFLRSEARILPLDSDFTHVALERRRSPALALCDKKGLPSYLTFLSFKSWRKENRSSSLSPEICVPQRELKSCQVLKRVPSL